MSLAISQARRIRASLVTTAGLIALSACFDGSGPEMIRLADLSEPDTNTAVVVLSRNVQHGTEVLVAGEEYLFQVRQDRIPHTLLVERVVSGDTASVLFVIADLYTTGTVLTDGSANRFEWSGTDDTAHLPVVPCEVHVTEAYILGVPSVQSVETACRVASPTGVTLTVFAKAKRHLSMGGG